MEARSNADSKDLRQEEGRKGRRTIEAKRPCSVMQRACLITPCPKIPLALTLAGCVMQEVLILLGLFGLPNELESGGDACNEAILGSRCLVAGCSARATRDPMLSVLSTLLTSWKLGCTVSRGPERNFNSAPCCPPSSSTCAPSLPGSVRLVKAASWQLLRRARAFTPPTIIILHSQCARDLLESGPLRRPLALGFPSSPQQATDDCDSGKATPPRPRYHCDIASSRAWTGCPSVCSIHPVGAQALLARSRVRELPSARTTTDSLPNHEQCATFRTPQSVIRAIHGSAI
ncbi:hypothetical protein KC319_g6 [Hortaea werneckii]|nr:hypothetical protein KC319_g6 [Hortaea werneckii]